MDLDVRRSLDCHPVSVPVLAVFVLIALARESACNIVASDDAASAAYAAEGGGAWKGLNPTAAENPAGMDNGGSGFLPWNFQGGFHNPSLSPYGNLNHFIDGVDFPSSGFNNLGSPAFGLTNANAAYSGYTSRATRVLAQPLAIGGSVIIDFDNPVLASLAKNDETGYLIRLNSGGGPKVAGNPSVYERLGFFAFQGFHQENWSVADALGVSNSGLSSTATLSGARLQFTLLAAEFYRLDILPLAGGEPLLSRTGNLANPATGSIDTLEIAIFGNGSGNGLTGTAAAPTGQREFFFDNLIVMHPPAILPGDYNGSGTVDAADYVVWRKNPGNFPADAYATWRTNFGQPGSGSGASANAAVPEPSTLLTLVLAAAGFFLRRRWTFDKTQNYLAKLYEKRSRFVHNGGVR